MNIKTQKALKMAIKEMTDAIPHLDIHFDDYFEAIQACKEALEQPAQEPIGYYYPDERMACLLFKKGLEIPRDALPLYGSPAPSWQGLSDDELSELFAKCGWVEENGNLRELGFYRHARMLEQALKEKNSV